MHVSIMTYKNKLFVCFLAGFRYNVLDELIQQYRGMSDEGSARNLRYALEEHDYYTC